MWSQIRWNLRVANGRIHCTYWNSLNYCFTHKRVEPNRFLLEPFPVRQARTQRWQEMWWPAMIFSRHALESHNAKDTVLESGKVSERFKKTSIVDTHGASGITLCCNTQEFVVWEPLNEMVSPRYSNAIDLPRPICLSLFLPLELIAVLSYHSWRHIGWIIQWSPQTARKQLRRHIYASLFLPSRGTHCQCKAISSI